MRLIINLQTLIMSLNTRNKEKYNLHIKIQQSHKNIETFKRVNFKPILNYMKPNYYSKATIHFFRVLPNKPNLLIDFIVQEIKKFHYSH